MSQEETAREDDGYLPQVEQAGAIGARAAPSASVIEVLDGVLEVVRDLVEL